MALGTADAVAVFCEATRVRDIDRIVSTLAPDAELLSPLSGRMVFRGRDDLRVLLGAVYGGLSNLVWREVIGEGTTRVAVSDAQIRGCHDHRRDGARARRRRADCADPASSAAVAGHHAVRSAAGAEDSPLPRRGAPRSATLIPNHLRSAACNRSSSSVSKVSAAQAT